MYPKENNLSAKEIQIAMPWGIVGGKSWNQNSMNPMLVLHGTDDNAASFDALIPLLLPDYHYVCIDLPGHGFSSAFTPGLPLSFTQYLSALQRIVRFFQWEEFSIMAHSFGTQLAMFLAAAEKDKIARLILLDGTCGSPLCDEVYLVRCTGELEEILESENDHKARPQLTAYELAVSKRTSRTFPLSSAAAERILSRELVKTNKGVYKMSDSRSFFTTRAHMSENVHLYSYKSIKCPVLIVFSQDSPIREFHVSDFHQAVLKTLLASHKMSRIAHVDGSHNVLCDHPQNLAPTLNTFLKETKDVKRAIRSKV